ncbi:MAG: histidinol dehydrogenase [Elusimicrobia bacterium]|nr:histidinol dehydrogenase [Elusimicrobiota bacterium]
MKSTSEEVARIIQRVRQEGDHALTSYTRRFDGISLPSSRFRVSVKEIRQVSSQVAAPISQALEAAAREIRVFARVERRYQGRSWSLRRGRKLLMYRVVPLESVGIYIPGGHFAYPSTVLMTAIPAKVAGVPRIVMVSPPKHLTPEVLFAGKLAGVDEVYRVGGPWAIAALAFGTRSIAPVDKIVGPGNRYVTEAKRQVFGQVGIDLLAGPSEVVVIADDTTPVTYVVAELLAQAEHDPGAHARLFTTSERLFRAVKYSLNGAPRRWSQQIHAVRVPHLMAAVQEVNRLAPEHVALYVRDASRWIPLIRHAGALFVGRDTPIALGDYVAGPSHVLPTGRAARFSGGLSVAHFLKATQVITYKGRDSHPDLRIAETLARTEGMKAHAASLRVRLNAG